LNNRKHDPNQAKYIGYSIEVYFSETRKIIEVTSLVPVKLTKSTLHRHPSTEKKA